MKNIFKKAIILLITCILSAGVSFSQKKWTINECIEYALTNNIDINSFKLSLKATEIAHSQSKLNYIPAVSANVGYSFNTGRVLDPTTYTFVENRTVNNVNAGLSANTTLFAGMQKYNNLKKTGSDLEATRTELLQLENNTALNISLYFLQILLNKEIVSSIEKQVESSVQNISRMESMVNHGAATRGDLLNLEAQKANEDYTLADARTNLNSAIIELCQLMNLRDYADFDVIAPVFHVDVDIFKTPIDVIFNAALSLPEVVAKEQRHNSSIFALKAAKSAYYPRLNANYSFSSSYSDSRRKVLLDGNGSPTLNPDGEIVYTNYPFIDQIKDNRSQALSLSLSIPIFTSLSVRNNVRTARLSTEKALYDVENARNKLYKEVNKAVNDVTGARMQYISALAKATANTESMGYTEVKFTSGAATITDYVLSKNNLMIAEAQMAQAKYTYIFKLKVIDYFLGRGISFTE